MKKLITVVFVVCMFLFSGVVYADLINGGFETGNSDGWSTSGNVQVIGGDDLPFGWQDTDEDGNPVNYPNHPYGYFIESPEYPLTHFSPYEGSSMIKIGSHSATENWAYNNFIYQILTGDYYLPKLTFALNMWSYDYENLDRFRVGVKDQNDVKHLIWEVPAGYVSSDSEPPTLDYSGWHELTFDLTPYLGENATNFVIYFDAGDIGDTVQRTRTGVYLDSIHVTSEPIPEPATMLLLGSGLVGLAGFRRKSKK